MDDTLVRFSQALRSAGLEVSPAETLDAAAIMSRLGIGDRGMLAAGLSLAFAKSAEAKQTFASVFEQFFSTASFQQTLDTQLAQHIDGLALRRFARELTPTAQSVIDEVLMASSDKLLMRLQNIRPQMGNLRERGIALRRWEAAVAINELKAARGGAPPAISDALGYVSHYLQTQVQQYADTQYQLTVNRTGNQGLAQRSLSGSLAHIPPAYQAQLDEAARLLAQRLRKSSRRRQRQANRGALNLPKMLRANVAYGGDLVEIAWQRKRSRAAKVFVVCDVSNSVRNVARLLLTFLFALGDALPQLRGFAFSNRLGEITHHLQHASAVANERALAETLERWGQGRSDYGQAFVDLQALLKSDLDRRSTLIILGDARNNYFPARIDVFAGLAKRAGRVFWLNPEAKIQWPVGDSVMPLYQRHCLEALTCNRVHHLQRLATRLLPR